MKVRLNENDGKRTEKTGFTGVYPIDRYLEKNGMEKGAWKLLMNPPKENDFRLLHDIKKATDILLRYEKNQEKTRIMGDYDCDGITGTSILLKGLETLNIDYDIPMREEGYGMNTRMVEKAHADGVKLIITVDNGIQCHEAIELAKDYGMTVIVTDHHPLGETLPNADAIVHPFLEPYPFKGISGATVAMKLMLSFGVSEETENEIRQLAALSIISDVMPVGAFTEAEMKNNENRYLLIDGLNRIHRNPSPQLKLFCDVIGVDTGIMDEKDIGFTIAPVLNSTGRLADAKIGVEILTSYDEGTVEKNAGYAAYLNSERKEITKTEAAKVKDDGKPAAVMVSEAGHGIVGIIAGNINKTFDKPAVVFAKRTKPDGTIELAGSGRSSDVPLVDVFKAMPQDIFVTYGGHAQAAGVTIRYEKLNDFEESFCRLVQEMMPEKEEKNNIHTSFSLIQSKEAEKALRSMKPFGNGFPEPEFDLDFDLSRIDLFFASRHCAISDSYGHQLWLYGQLAEGKKMAEQSSFRKVGDNTEKRRIEKGLSEQEAFDGHWERWSGNAVPYKATVNANYGSFQGITGVQLSTVQVNLA